MPSKRYKKALEVVDAKKAYSLKDAVGVLAKFPKAKFNETIDLAFRLGVDPKQSDQMVRGTVPLPHGTGKTVRVLVFAKNGAAADAAKAAGAEFVGYEDNRTNRVAVYANGKKKWVFPPVPSIQLIQMNTDVRVRDGQTVVLGGLLSETVNTLKDQVPMLGDLPLVGRFFRSESKATTKKNLLVFITPTLIDQAGNRLHSEEEMPFTERAIPQQPPR